jgi:hypothetical protein
MDCQTKIKIETQAILKSNVINFRYDIYTAITRFLWSTVRENKFHLVKVTLDFK